MKKNFVIVVGLCALALSAHAQNIAGDWQGTLHAGIADLRLVLHVSKAPDGTWKATLDSVDQGANGIPVNSVQLKDSNLDLTVDAVQGSYHGKISADANTITGTWKQQQALPLEFKRSTTPIKTEHKPAKPSDIDGAWIATLDTGEGHLHLIFKIVNTEDGLIATVDSPDQNMKGLPASSVTRKDASLKMEWKAIGGSFDGKINTDRTTIDGTWAQSGREFPLALKRAKDASELERRRPQEPKKPYPYREEQMQYPSKGAGVTLAATLTIPSGKGPFPAVVLLTGSGPQDRDETLAGHRPFLILSDHLTRKGIAVLRADDRGTAKSTGDFTTATTADFADDAEGGVAFLKTRAEVDPHHIGLIGHSEGGIEAPMVAARNPDVAFIVLMASPGIRGDQILVAQARDIFEVSGMSHAEAEKAAEREQKILSLVEGEKDNAVLDTKLRQILTSEVPSALVGLQVKQVETAWFRYFIEFDPAATLRQVKCPVLAINGEKDLQVRPSENLPAIRKALEAGGNRHFETVELPGLNHLFQTAKTGAPAEYAEIEETISPVALEKISSWILKQ